LPAFLPLAAPSLALPRCAGEGILPARRPRVDIIIDALPLFRPRL
jgi:hypothetical protein